jgi:hypothetical protein
VNQILRDLLGISARNGEREEIFDQFMIVQALAIFLQQTLTQTRTVACAMMFRLVRYICHHVYPVLFSVIFAHSASRIIQMALQPVGLSRI